MFKTVFQTGLVIISIALSLIVYSMTYGVALTSAEEPPIETIGEPWTAEGECLEAVSEALKMWNHQMPINIECYFETSDFVIDQEYNIMQLAYADHMGGNNWRIVIRPFLSNYSLAGFKQVIRHEVGHCLLIRHNHDPASVMFPIIFDSNLQQIDDWDRHMYDVRWHGFKTVLSDLASD